MPGQEYVEQPEEEKEPEKQFDVCLKALAELNAILIEEDF